MRRTEVVAASACLAALLAGCGNGDGAKGYQPPATRSVPSHAPDQAAKSALQAELDKLQRENPITFEPDGHQLSPDGERAVSQAAKVLKRAPEQLKFEIAGYAARSPGSSEDPLLLSQQRAQAVADELTRAGVPAERLQVTGHGNAQDTSRKAEIKVV